MLIETTILSLVVGLLLFFFGIYVNKKGYWLSLTGSLVIMILGIMLFNSPILFNNGATVETFGIQDVITYTYTAQDSTINLVLAWVFMLLGLFGILISSSKLYGLRFSESNIDSSEI